MKISTAVSALILSINPVVADEEYTDMVYTSVTLLYWCVYKEVPKNEIDISKVTNLDEPNNKITVGFNKWLKTVSYTIDGDEMIITKGTTTSKSDCASVQMIEK